MLRNIAFRAIRASAEAFALVLWFGFVAIAVALLEQKLNPDTIRCPDCRAILSVPIAPHPRAVTEVLCGPEHEVRFDDGSAFVST